MIDKYYDSLYEDPETEADIMKDHYYGYVKEDVVLLIYCLNQIKDMEKKKTRT